METISIPTGSPLCTTFTIHEATGGTAQDGIIVLHHGICHTREHFAALIAELNSRGFQVAMIDQQSEHAGPDRNYIGPGSYRRGMAAAVRTIMARTGRDVLCYVLHSMGAMIGEEMQAQRFNRNLRRPTVLMAPIPVHGALPVTVKLFLNDPLKYLQAVATFNIHLLAETPQQVKKLFFEPGTDQEIVERATRQLRHASFWVYCRLVLRPLIFWRWIFNDGNPKLLLYSESDFLFNHRWEFAWTRWLYPQVEVHELSGGHDFFIQHATKTAEKIEAFLKPHAAPFEATNAQQQTPAEQERKPLLQQDGVDQQPGQRIEAQPDVIHDSTAIPSPHVVFADEEKPSKEPADRQQSAPG